MTSMPLREVYNEATALHQRGHLAEAEGLYRQLLSADPQAFAPRHMLGVLLAQQGRLAEDRKSVV